jgi:hypothetical protein
VIFSFSCYSIFPPLHRSSRCVSSQGDYFAVELLSGHVFLHLDLGSGAIKVKATSRRIDDGTWHEIALSRNGKSGRINVDGSTTDFVTPGTNIGASFFGSVLATSHFSTFQRSALGDAYQLDLEGSLLVGGIGSAVDNAAIPPNLWSATLRYGYVGCMRDLIINGNAVDLAAFARQQDSGGWQHQTGLLFQSDTLHAQQKTLIDWVVILGNRTCRGHTTGVSRAASSVRIAALYERRSLHGRMESILVRLFSHQFQRTYVWQR